MVIEHMYQRFILKCFPTLQVGVVRFSSLSVLSSFSFSFSFTSPSFSFFIMMNTINIIN